MSLEKDSFSSVLTSKWSLGYDFENSVIRTSLGAHTPVTCMLSPRVCVCACARRNTEGKICTAANLSTGTKHMFGLELCMVGSNFSCACGLGKSTRSISLFSTRA